MKYISVENWLRHRNAYQLIDVRSPKEFDHARIEGAINIPLFNNEERAEIGTLYKQEGKQMAIERGLEIVGPKMADMVRMVRALQLDKEICIHCWRGGMRSASVAWLFETAGFKVTVLDGGYKAFRRMVANFWEQDFKLYILGGSTGSGKTEILHHLKNHGEQVLDLEHLANHKGSAFGALEGKAQPNSEQYQNNIFFEMIEMDSRKPIWIEDESINLGRAFLSDVFWLKMRESPLFIVNLAVAVRVQRLVDDYGSMPKDKLRQGLETIKRKLGGLRFQEAVRHLEEGLLDKVVEDILFYYDRAYSSHIARRNHLIQFEKEYNEFDPELICKDLLSVSSISLFKKKSRK